MITTDRLSAPLVSLLIDQGAQAGVFTLPDTRR